MQFMIQFLNRKDELKYTALHRSVFARNLESFTYLLDKGCDVNIKCHGTPLLQLLLAASLLPIVSSF
jgi:ankyrin repeat protein